MFKKILLLFSFLDYEISQKSKQKEKKLKKTPIITENKIINNVNDFIEKNRNKMNFISKNEIELRQKKSISRSHYVGYDPDEVD